MLYDILESEKAVSEELLYYALEFEKAVSEELLYDVLSLRRLLVKSYCTIL